MPRNQFQRMVFAFITVVFTVHAYVFYSLYVLNGNLFMQLTGAPSVLAAIKAMGGVPMCGTHLPIWACVLIEFAFAYTLEVLMGSPCSFKLACRHFDPRKNHPMIFESAIICATAAIMCPAMSFIATFLYFPYGMEPFNFVTVMAHWFKLVIFNFPFAVLSQLFFIQPLVRGIFRTLFRKDIQKHNQESQKVEAETGLKLKAQSEEDAIADIAKRDEEIKAENK